MSRDPGKKTNKQKHRDVTLGCSGRDVMEGRLHDVTRKRALGHKLMSFGRTKQVHFLRRLIAQYILTTMR